MDKKSLQILQINALDSPGGAAKVAYDLHTTYQKRGCNSYLAVGLKNTSDPFVVPFENGYFDFLLQLKKGKKLSLDSFYLVTQGIYQLSLRLRNPALRRLGQEVLYYPGIWRLFPVKGIQPDIVHCHNLHGGYFDLKALTRISLEYPLVLTLHDAWLLAGHCAHSFTCNKWRAGCRKCPDITIPLALQRDGSAQNWKVKRSIFQKSSFNLVTPCNWLMERVEQSIVNEGIISKTIIPNGVDQTIFHPGNQSLARIDLGLPENAIVILFAANGIKVSVWKDYPTLHKVICSISKEKLPKKVIFIALGDNSPSEKFGNTEIRYIPHIKNPEIIAKYYRASDIYLHPARAETFPLTIIEAMSSGIPVIASAVGGIPEQVEEGITGFLTPVGSVDQMVDSIVQLIRDGNLHESLGKNAERIAKEKYSLELQTDRYLNFYKQLLKDPQ